MADFTTAVNTLLTFEGEEYTDYPEDAGGATKWGVTLGTLRLVEPGAKVAEILHMDKPKAVRVFHEVWWEPYGYNRINSTCIATRILMAAVHCGPHRGHLLAQIAANAATIDVTPDASDSVSMIAEDGLIGPETVGRLNEINHSFWIRAFRGALAAHYHRQVEAKKSQRMFLKGWLRRAYY